MGLLGTILSIVPTVAGVVGKLFGADANDYIKFSVRHSSDGSGAFDDDKVYFTKKASGGIMFHNGCSFPVHFSMENKNSVKGDVGSDMTVGECTAVDVTDLIANYSAKNVDRIRISANVPPESEDNAVRRNVVSVVCKGKLDREVKMFSQMCEYISMKRDVDDIVVSVHSGCTVLEIVSFSIKGEGNEPENLYESLTPADSIPGINGMITWQTSDEVTTIVFKDAAKPFIYSDVLQVEAVFVCEIANLPAKKLHETERAHRLAGPDWEFLRTGRCLN